MTKLSISHSEIKFSSEDAHTRPTCDEFPANSFRAVNILLSQPALDYLLWLWRRLHVALWWGRSLHDLLGGWRRWRWRMWVTGHGLVARWRRHWLTRSRHDVARLRRWVLGYYCWSLIHGGWLRVLTGTLPT